MGIFRLIKDKRIFISVDIDESLIAYDIDGAIKYATELTNELNSNIASVHALEDLLNYFAVQKIASFGNYLSCIEKEEYKAIISDLSEKAKSEFAKYSTGNIITYFNNNYTDIFAVEEENEINLYSDLKDAFFPSVDFCIKYQTGISDSVFEFLAEYHWYVWIEFFDQLRKKLLSSEDIFNKVFSDNNIEFFISRRAEELIVILKSLENKDTKYYDWISRVKKVLLDKSIEKMSVAEDRDFLLLSDSMRRIRRYFAEIKYNEGRIKEFDNTYKEFEEKSSDYIHENGQVFSEEIPTDEIKKMFDQDLPWDVKLFLTTHTIDTHTHKGKSHFSFDSSKFSKIADIVSHNIDTDGYFTFSRQNSIDFLANFGGITMILIFDSKYIQETANHMLYFLKVIEECFDIDKKELTDDCINVFHSLQILHTSSKVGNKEDFINLAYGSSMLIIASIEKLLRLIYKSKNEIVLSDDYIQLKSLLDNDTIEEILTTDLTKAVGYFLSRYGYIGKNYRNRLAHLSDIKINELDFSFPFTLFYLYLSIINAIIIYLIEKETQNDT